MNPGRLLLGCVFCGLIAGGLRSPVAWTPVAVVIWLLAFASGRRVPAAVVRPWLLWLAWGALSALCSTQPLKSLYPWTRWLGLIAFWGLIRVTWNEQDRRHWFWGLASCGFVLGLAALWTGSRTLLAHGSGEGMYGLLPPYYNYTMFVAAAAIAAIFAALIHPRGPTSERRSLWVLLGFGIIILLLARARGGFLAVVAAAFVSAWRLGRLKRLLIPGAILACALSAITWGVVISRRTTVPFKGGIADFWLKRDKAFKRPQIWRSAVAIAADNPILGEGPGNFEQGFKRHNFASQYGVTNYQFSTAFAHSEPLQAAAETGWAGLILFIFALAFSVRTPPAGKIDYVREGAFSAALAMSLMGLIDNMLHIPALAMLFLSALACAQNPAVGAQRKDSSLWIWKAVPVAGLALSLSAWLPERLALVYSLSEGLEPAIKMVRLFPGDGYFRENLARAYLRLSPPQLNRALEELEKASSLDPTNALYLVMRAEVLRAQGRADQVLALAQQAASLEPNFLQARLLRAEALAQQGRKVSARLEVEEVLKRRRELRRLEPYLGKYRGYEAQVSAFDPKRFDLVSRLVKTHKQ